MMPEQKIEPEAIVKRISELIPFYTPEWEFINDPKDPGTALINIFAWLYAGACQRFNQVPHKNLLAFLDMLGVEPLPAQKARVPVTFTLSRGASGPVLIPAGTEVVANPADGGSPIIFATESNLVATPAKLVKLIRTIPAIDGIFSESGENNLQEHSIYLAHSECFNLRGKGIISLSFSVSGAVLTIENLTKDLSWEWWDEGIQQWISSLEDKGDRLQVQAVIEKVSPQLDVIDGVKGKKFPRPRQLIRLSLTKEFTAGFKQTRVCGRENFWLRCRVVAPLARDSVFAKVRFGDVHVQVGPLTEQLEPDGLFCNDVPLTVPRPGKPPLYPFGKRPRTFDTCYIANHDALTKQGAEISLEVKLSSSDPAMLTVRQIQGIGPEFAKRLMNYTENNQPCPIDTVSKLLEKSVEELMRILSEPGHPVSFKRAQNIREAAEKEFYDKNREANKREQTVISVSDADLSLSWEYWNGTGWQVIKTLEDGTANFTHSGTVKFKTPSDIAATAVNGQRNHWFRVRIVNGDYGREKYIKASTDSEIWQVSGEDIHPPKLMSLTMNYAYPTTQIPQLEECITFNNLTYSQKKSGFFRPFEALPDLKPSLYLGFAGALSKGSVSMFMDFEEGQTQGSEGPSITWEYYRGSSTGTTNGPETGRLEVLDGTINFTRSGIVEFQGSRDFSCRHLFGTDLYWLRAVAGTTEPAPRIKDIRVNSVWASAEGGTRGNVKVGEISFLRTSVAFVDKVTNHVSAAGGTAAEVMEQVVKRGPQILKHGNRAVTAEDYEWLARQASPNIARVKCFPNYTDKWEKKSGWVTVVIVPEGNQTRPRPDWQLKNLVGKYLRERAPGVVTARNRLRVREPEYKEITVTTTIIVNDFELVPLVEKRARERLSYFLHPLQGGSEGKGWEFGRHPYLSDFYGLFEEIEGVDFVAELSVDDSDIQEYCLVYSGNHQVTVNWRRG